MAAVLSHHPESAPWNEPGALAPAPHGPDRGDRPSLRLVEGGRAPARPAPSVRPAWVSIGAGLLIALLVALGAVAGSHVLGADAAAPGPASTADLVLATGTPATVVVQAGDTLWSIARRIQPRGDVRPLVDRLVERAGGVALVTGQRIDVSGLTD